MWRPRLEPLPNWDALHSLAPTYGSLHRTVARVCSFNLLANPHFGSGQMSSRSVGLLVKGAPSSRAHASPSGCLFQLPGICLRSQCPAHVHLHVKIAAC